ncbi:type VI secretion system accessory protein TagJ, partial [Noviherbaspirillum sp.]
TEWTEKATDVYWGVGQRMLTTDRGDYPLMEIRSVQLNVTVDVTVEAV